MENKWNSYFWDNNPRNVMKNKFEIRHFGRLEKAEFILTQKNSHDLMKTFKISGNTAVDLANIHRIFLGDLYDWAGAFRNVNMRKGNHSFLDVSLIELHLKAIDQTVDEFRSMDTSENIFVNLAKIHNKINEVHAFREGNGRTQRFFINALAMEKGYVIDFSYDALNYLTAAINNDVNLMAQVIEKGLTQIDKVK